jgi:hypothetical protein
VERAGRGGVLGRGGGRPSPPVRGWNKGAWREPPAVSDPSPACPRARHRFAPQELLALPAAEANERAANYIALWGFRNTYAFGKHLAEKARSLEGPVEWG